MPYGARILLRDGDQVKARQEFAEWDPFSTFILTEEAGRVRFRDVVLGISMVFEIRDDFTGLISQVITDPKDEKLQPMVEIIDPNQKDEKGEPVVKKRYFLPKGANLDVKDGDEVLPVIYWLKFQEKWPEPKILPVVCPVGRGTVRSQAAQEPGGHFRN